MGLPHFSNLPKRPIGQGLRRNIPVAADVYLWFGFDWGGPLVNSFGNPTRCGLGKHNYAFLPNTSFVSGEIFQKWISQVPSLASVENLNVEKTFEFDASFGTSLGSTGSSFGFSLGGPKVSSRGSDGAIPAILDCI